MPQLHLRIQVLMAAAALAGGGAASAQAPRMMASDVTNMPAIPSQDENGAFRTINYGLDPGQTLWHVRAALNVAALGCDGMQATMAASYNRFIIAQRKPLAAANQAIVARYKARYGSGWTAQYDAYMTSLYNFFAQPFVKSAFCAAAQPLSAETATLTPATVQAFAMRSLPRLEAPFTEFYQRWQRYQVALADYQRDPGARRAPVAPSLQYVSFDVALDAAPVELPPARVSKKQERRAAAALLASAAPAPTPVPAAASLAPAPVRVAAATPAPVITAPTPAPTVTRASAPVPAALTPMPATTRVAAATAAKPAPIPAGLSPSAYTRLLLASMQDRPIPAVVQTATETAPTPASPALSYQLPN